MTRLLFLILALNALPSWAQGANEALLWLQRVADAAQRLTYSGTFVFQSGNRSESSRIVHWVEGGSEFERIEALDGSPREVVRKNDEVKCFLPESRVLIVEQRGSRRAFPALLPASLASLNENYTIRKGVVERVAEREGQVILVSPRDDLRYGHQFWIDTQSGLLLRASLLNERGEPLETFAFTKLDIGGTVDRELLKPRSGNESVGWQVHSVRTVDARGEDPWMFKAQLPGFRKLSGMKRQVRPGGPETSHVVFSDGLAAVSVFIEPLGKEKFEPGLLSIGAINVYKRLLGDHRLVAMGDVPPLTLQRLGDGVEAKRK
jgi:sigma-E factor negative regulatory protein RseB